MHVVQFLTTYVLISQVAWRVNNLTYLIQCYNVPFSTTTSKWMGLYSSHKEWNPIQPNSSHANHFFYSTNSRLKIQMKFLHWAYCKTIGDTKKLAQICDSWHLSRQTEYYTISSLEIGRWLSFLQSSIVTS